jgi:transposase
MSPSYLHRSEQMKLPNELKFVLYEPADEWRNLSLRIKRLEKELEGQAKKETEREKILRSVPGVGPITSRVLSAEQGRQIRQVKGLARKPYALNENQGARGEVFF